jgi:PAS domain S-box-containing protein
MLQRVIKRKFQFLPSPVTLFVILVLPGFHFCLAHLSRSLSFEDGVAAIWPSSGVYLAMVLFYGHRQVWAGILISELLINSLLFYDGILTNIGISLVGLFEPLVTGFLIQRSLNPQNLLNQSQTIFKFMGLVISGSIVSTTFAVTLLGLCGEMPWSVYHETWRVWLTTVITGSLVVTPALLAWLRPLQPQHDSQFRSIEFTLLLILGIAIGGVTFRIGYPVEYMIIPLLIWAAFRLSQRETTLLIIVASVIAVWGTAQGFGPFVRITTSESLFLLQFFINVMAITAFVLTAVVHENRRIKLILSDTNSELEQRVQARTSELQHVNEQLQVEVIERKLAEQSTVERSRLTALDAEVGLALIQNDPLPHSLQQCAEALVRHLDAAFVRIWTLQPTDDMLELQASAGLYSHLNGSHSRIAVGQLKIGKIAQERQPCLTNAVIGDPHIGDQAWARREGMVAFAGYPLIVEERLVGVIALFARQVLSETTLQALGSVASVVASGIQRKWSEIERMRLLMRTRAARAEAEATRNQIASILESITDGFFALDKHWRFMYLNPQGEHLLQRSKDELIGQNIWEAFPEMIGSAFYGQYHKVMAEQTSIEFEEFYPPLSSWFSVHAYPAQRGISVYFQGINERKKAEAHLLRISTAVENASDGILITTMTARPTYHNRAFIEQYGYTVDALVQAGGPIALFSQPEMGEHVLNTIQNERSWNGEIELKTKTGRTVSTLLRANCIIDEFGQRIGLIGICTDITERKRAEAEIREALAKEKELSELKSRFVSMTSHEFRTPLSVITLSSGLLESYSYKWTEDKKRQHFQRIQTSVQRMTRLLDDILFIAREEAGKLELKPTKLNLSQFCSDLVEEMQLSTGTQHTLIFLSRGQCTEVWMDEKLLRQILSNLLSNAIKYSPHGGNIDFELSCQAGEAIFQIKDTGIGVPVEDQQHLFESFHRASNVGTISGTGLGLAIVKKSVDLHHGTITLTSKVGVGTVFTVSLPLQG